MRTRNFALMLGVLGTFLAACAGSLGPIKPSETSVSPPLSEINAAASRAEGGENALPTTVAGIGEAEPASPGQPPPSLTLTNRRVEVGEINSFPQLLPFDGIRPVYEPEFVAADLAPLDDDELVIGLALEGEAKAYSITVLRSREMVNDELAGIPTLVTW